jgi:L-iditol 2-dehydrogenase
VAVHAVGITQIRPYDSVLVIGAGTIGLLTMQVLLLSGARQVVVSDVSDARLEVARRMGAVDVVNPSKTDFDAYVRSFTAGHGFDITFEAVGITPTVAQSVTAVKDGGKIVWIGNNQRTVEVDMQAIVTRELSVLGTYGMNDRDFGRALQMLADGKIDVASLVTRRAALSEGPTLFDELLHDPETIKCVIQMA